MTVCDPWVQRPGNDAIVLSTGHVFAPGAITHVSTIEVGSHENAPHTLQLVGPGISVTLMCPCPELDESNIKVWRRARDNAARKFKSECVTKLIGPWAIFSKETASMTDPECDDVISGGAYFNWGWQGCGFGQLSFKLRPDGKFDVMNEAMGPDSVRKLLHAFADYVADHAVLEDEPRSSDGGESS